MVYVFLADGFEMIEALCTVDMLRRAKVYVKTVSITSNEYVMSNHNVYVKADMTKDEFPAFDNLEDKLEAIVLPGGMPGTTNLEQSSFVDSVLKYVAKENAENKEKIVDAAICAAPSVLGVKGMLKGKKAICFPGFEDKLLNATVVNGAKVVADGEIITGKAMGVSHDFALEIIKALRGEEISNSIKHAVYYEQ